MAYLDFDLQLSILQSLSVEMSKTLIEKMPHDTRVDLLNRLPQSKRNEVMRYLAKVERDVLFSKKLIQGNILYPVKLRITFLFVTLVGGFLVGSVIDRFEEVLSAIIVAAVFIPVIMDMGGNVGTQSTTIFECGLALGHIKLEKI